MPTATTTEETRGLIESGPPEWNRAIHFILKSLRRKKKSHPTCQVLFRNLNILKIQAERAACGGRFSAERVTLTQGDRGILFFFLFFNPKRQGVQIVLLGSPSAGCQRKRCPQGLMGRSAAPTLHPQPRSLEFLQAEEAEMRPVSESSVPQAQTLGLSLFEPPTVVRAGDLS